MWKYIPIIAALVVPSFSYASNCEDLTWKRIKRDGHRVTYRGHVKPGTYSIHAELLRRGKVIGQDLDFPNPGGNWEIFVYADHVVRNSDIPRFYCQ